MAKDMGVKPEFKVYEWNNLIPALRKGEIDIIAAGMAINPARALRVEFTQPTATSGVGIAGIYFDRANVTAYATPALAETEVLEGRAHVYLAGMPAARYLALRSDTVDVPVDKPLLAHSEGIAVRKGEQSLMNFLNSWITVKSSDGWMATTRSYWFEEMGWAAELNK